MTRRQYVVLEEGTQPLLIREHARKYQLILGYRLVLQKHKQQVQVHVQAGPAL